MPSPSQVADLITMFDDDAGRLHVEVDDVEFAKVPTSYYAPTP